MSEAILLPAEARQTSGKGGARAVRRADMVPGIIYGGKDAPVPVAIELRRVNKEMEKPNFANTNYDIEVGGKKFRVLPREVQTDPVSDRPIHIDFLRISETTVVTVEVPVHFINEKKSPGLVRGAVLNIVRHAIEAHVPAGHIPDAIEVDLSGLEIGDSIHISSVALPSDMTPTITDRDFTIATIAAPTVARADEDDDEAQEDVAEAPDEDEGDDEE